MQKILIVDDTKLFRDALVIILKDAFGCEVDEACDGLDALAKLQTSRYSLVLIDYEMPVMNGFECVRQIRELEEVAGSHTPIICMTASGESDIKQKCLDAGMDDYLSKECSDQEIENAVRNWVAPITIIPLPTELPIDSAARS